LLIKENTIKGMRVNAKEISRSFVRMDATMRCSPNISLTLISRKTAMITITLAMAGLLTCGRSASIVNSSDAIAPRIPTVTIQSLTALRGITEVKINASRIEMSAYGIPR